VRLFALPGVYGSMLEHFTESHRAPRRRIGPVAGLSIAAHAAALFALVGTGAWRVDKLETAEPPLVLASIGFPLPAAGGDEQPVARSKGHRKPRVLAQPTKVRSGPDEPPGQTIGTGDKGPPQGLDLLHGCPPGAACEPGLLEGVTEPVCGNGRVEDGEECDDGARAGGDGCSPACRQEVAIVPAKMIEGYRVAGDPQIQPPEPVRAEMAQKQQRQATGTIRMCLARDGSVASLRVMKSTGYATYDERLTTHMREWRYRPYRLAGGNAVPVCTAVTFIFQLSVQGR
jgi:TonB family protein